MRILAIYRHYWPDTAPYGRLLRAMLEHLTRQGHKASVFTAQPSYNDIQHERQPSRDVVGGVEITRLSLLPERKHLLLVRGLNFAYFLLRATLHAIFSRQYDIIITNSHPPILMGVALQVIKRLTGRPYIFHCLDIHPESSIQAGRMREGGLSDWLRRIDARTCQEAKLVVTCSNDMRNTLCQRARQELSVRVINNFPQPVYGDHSDLPATFQSLSAKPFRVLFAGNLGFFQNLPTIVEAAHLLADRPDIQFIFMGAGALRQKLMNQAGAQLGKTIFFEPYQPVETAFACMQRADLGIVSLAAGIYKVAYPSKTMSLVAAGCPLLVLVEPESDLAHEVREQNFGYYTSALNAQEIANSIQAACEDRGRWTPEARQELSQRGLAYFGEERVMSQWTEVMADLQREIAPQPSNQREIMVK